MSEESAVTSFLSSWTKCVPQVVAMLPPTAVRAVLQRVEGLV